MTIPKNNRVYINLPTPVARVGFPPSLFTKSHIVVNGQTLSREPQYRVSILIPKNLEGDEKKLFTSIQAAVREVAEKAFPLSPQAKASGAEWAYPEGFRNPFIDGDIAAPGKDVPEHQAGHWILRCSSNKDIIVSDGRVKPMRPITEESVVYAGCYVRLRINPWAYQTAGNLGVSFGFSQVMFYQDGESLGFDNASPDEAFEGMTPDSTVGAAVETTSETPANNGLT